MTLKALVTANRMLTSSAIIAASIGIELGSQLARTFLLARILDPREFGLVVSINTLFALVAMATAIGMDRFLVYTRNGGTALALNIAHAMSAVRGVLLGLLVLLLAYPTAMLIREEAEVASFAMVAIVPVIRGFAHLEVMQLQRQRIFWPSAIPETAGAIAGLAAAIVAAAIKPDHYAILWGLGVQAAVELAASHLLAREMPYRFSFDRAGMREGLRFSLPFAGNGLALAVSYQIDRLIVGAWLGVIALGSYSLLLTLLVQPLTVITRILTTMIQPALSAAWHDDPRGRFHALARRTGALSGLIGLSAATGVVCLGMPIWNLLFGGRYAVDGIVFVFLGIFVLVRAMRASLNLVGLAIGNTTELMVANLAGCAGPLISCLALYLYPSLSSAVLGLLVSDAASLTIIAIRLNRVIVMPDRPELRQLVTMSIGPALLAVWIGMAHPALIWRAAATAAVLGFSLLRAARLYRAAT